ncbi:MAG: S1 RNA-binding domain-containing protein, partial [Candidatus Cloacimonetes bacterium]|nr:S1 RNA-binding domain-containing protein [Candidatus Cloacimonadota bacterium]
LSISKEEKRISLGIKQMEPNPWVTIEERYPINSKLKGKIKSITPFGVFVEIEENIEGLIHISDISWTKRIYHPKEVFTKNQEVEVKILSIDKTLHRVALGIKQLFDDPWENLDERLPINTEIKAQVVKLITKGLLVDVKIDENIVEGFVPLSHLAIPGLRKAGMAFEIGEELSLKIIELDLENRRLILSVKAYFFAKDEKELQDFITIHQQKLAEKIDKRKVIKANLVENDEIIEDKSETEEDEKEEPKKETESIPEKEPEVKKPAEKDEKEEPKKETESIPEKEPEVKKPEEEEKVKEKKKDKEPEKEKTIEKKSEKKQDKEKKKEESTIEKKEE